MPSSKKAKRAMIKLLPLNLESGIIYELGSGWGGLAFLLAKHYPNAKIIAFERSLVPFLFSKILFRKQNLTILHKNFFDQDLSDASAIVCYLFPGAMKKLALKLKKELPKKTTMISNTFSLPDWENEEILFLDDLSATRIYRYIA